MSQSALRTKSGKAIRPAVIRSIDQQIERYDRALRLVEDAEDMVESERPPPPGTTAAPPRKRDPRTTEKE